MHSVRETSRQRERGTGAVQWRASAVKFVMAMQVMNAELDEVFQAMAIGAVPGLWKGKSFPSLKPLASYVDDLLRRLEMFSSWCAHLPPARAGSGVTAALLMGPPPPAAHHATDGCCLCNAPETHGPAPCHRSVAVY